MHIIAALDVLMIYSRQIRKAAKIFRKFSAFLLWKSGAKFLLVSVRLICDVNVHTRKNT